jgi:D-amino-acid dehydrogenase
MRVQVIGAGVAGVTTAYYLSRLGCDVTVLESSAAAGTGASFANGGQLSYSFTDSLANPRFLAALPGLLTGRDPAIKIKLDTGLLLWGSRFLRQCTSRRAKANTVAVLELAMRSAERMQELRESLPFDFSHRQAGKLVMLRNDEELAAAKAGVALKQQHGCSTTILTPGEATDIEPALADMAVRWRGAVHSDEDEVADAHAFVVELAAWLERRGEAAFRYGAAVEDIVVKAGRATALRIDGERYEADAVVVCLGAWSPALLRRTGVELPVYPVRGYSVTLPPGESPPAVSVTALSDRVLFSRINGRLRISGFADFLGFNDSHDPARTRALLESARRIAPRAADYSVDDVAPWGGLRPMTPDGRPRTGPTPVSGLFTNTGHGMLGWTLAAASAADLAQAVVRQHREG